jgi:ribose 5-phosphate isomerase A
MSDVEAEKRAAGEAAAALVPDGARVGLGTGSTVAYLLPALAARGLRLRCVATSPRTQAAAEALGLDVEAFRCARPPRRRHRRRRPGHARALARQGRRRRAHPREDRRRRGPTLRRHRLVRQGRRAPVPAGAPRAARVRPRGDAARRWAKRASAAGAPPSPDGGVIADFHGAIDDPAALVARLDWMPGVVGHGLFEPSLVSDVLVAREGRVDHRTAI